MASKKDFLHTLFENKRFVMAFSLITALVFWLVITISENPEREVAFSDLTISVSTEGTVAGDLGLDIISMSSQTASVKISAPSYVLSSLSSSDISVTASLADVSEAGTYTLNLAASYSKDSSVAIVSVTPSTITAFFDYTDTKQYNLEVEANGAVAVEGLIADTPVVSNSSNATIAVTGARSELERIARVVAVADVNDTLSTTTSFNAKIHLYDKNNTELDIKMFTLANDTVKISVPVLKQKEVSVNATFSNIPEGYATTSIPYTVSNSKLTILGPASTVDSLDKISLTPIDFFSISSSNKSFDVAPVLPNGVKIADNTTTVTVAVNITGYSEASYTVSAFDYKNVGSGLTASAVSVKNVKICGPKNTLRLLKSSDLYAVADLSGKTAGEYTVAVKIYSKTYNNIWQIGTYNVLITLK